MEEQRLRVRKGTGRSQKVKTDPRVALINGRVSPSEKADIWRCMSRFGFRTMSAGVCELALAFLDSQEIRALVRTHWRNGENA